MIFAYFGRCGLLLSRDIFIGAVLLTIGHYVFFYKDMPDLSFVANVAIFT